MRQIVSSLQLIYVFIMKFIKCAFFDFFPDRAHQFLVKFNIMKRYRSLVNVGELNDILQQNIIRL